MEIISGEIYHRSQQVQADDSTIDALDCDELLATLKSNDDPELQKAHTREKIAELRMIRSLSRTMTDKKLSGDIAPCIELIDEKKKHLLENLNNIIMKYESNIIKESNKIDTALLQWTLQYYSLLKDNYKIGKII